jgi:hypothetical protein
MERKDEAVDAPLLKEVLFIDAARSGNIPAMRWLMGVTSYDLWGEMRFVFNAILPLSHVKTTVSQC